MLEDIVFGDEAVDVLKTSKRSARDRVRASSRMFPKSGRMLQGGIRDQQVEIYPAWFAADPKMLEASSIMFEKLQENFSSDTPKFYQMSTKAGNFTQMLTVPGKMPDNAGYPSVVVEPSSPSDKYLFFTRLLIRTVISHSGEDRPYKIQLSGGGVIDPEADPEYKFTVTDRLVRYGGKRWIDMFCDDPRNSLLKYNDAPLINNGMRGQPDKFVQVDGKWTPKPRPIVDWAGYERGLTTVQDKTLDHLGPYFKGRASIRHRKVNGPTAPTTIVLSVMSEDIRQPIFDRFAHTWHHRGAADIESKVKGKFPVCLDIAGMDTHVPVEVFEIYAEEMSAKYGRLSRLISAWATAPTFTGDPRRGGDGTQSVWTSDPFFRDRRLIYNGLSSGVGTNTEIGKFAVVPALLEVASAAGLPVPVADDQMDLFLQGNWPRWICLNLGDDSLLGFDSKQDRQAFLSKLDVNFFDLTEEVPGKFLGFHVYVDDQEAVQRIFPSLISLVVNEICPEYTYRPPWHKGKSRRVRTAPGIGRAARDEVTLDVPFADEVKEIRDRVLYDYLKLTPGHFEMWARAEATYYGLPLGKYSIHDVHAIDDPSRASWDDQVADSPYAAVVKHKLVRPETRRSWINLLK